MPAKPAVNNYTLNIELNFKSQAEAQALMDACEPILVQASPENTAILARAISDEVGRIIHEAEASWSKLNTEYEQISEKAQAVAQLDRDIGNCCQRAKEKLDIARNEIMAAINEIVSHIHTIEQTIDSMRVGRDACNRELIELDSAIQESRNLKEAIPLLREFIILNQQIITGGKLKLLQDGQQVNGWHFQRD